ncbi:MAG TPA: carboxypeptidase-like regulatory domain-containing protein [Chitinophagaceae bacterium]
MAEQNTHINYSAEDIERYLRGGMSAKEMHAIEMAALQDPFLADAIEGFSNTSFEESHKHLNEITAALQTKKEETKIVPFPSKNFYWRRVAAIIIFVAGVGAASWYILGSNNGSNESEIAQVKENKSKTPGTVANKGLKNKTTTNDSLQAVIAQNGVPPSREQKKKNEAKKQEEVTNRTSTKTQAFARKIPEAAVADSFEKNKDVAADISSLSARLPNDTPGLQETSKVANVKSHFLNSDGSNNFTGRVTDNNNEPVAYATIRADEEAVTADSNGYFKLRAQDSILNVIVSSAGFVSANKQLESRKTNHISILPDETALSEVAITGYAKKQAKKNLVDSAYPSGGWKLFQEYVYKKSGKSIDTLNSKEMTGDVQIEFSIDKNGTPYDFIVLKSSDDKAASEAIEIIREGPRWITPSKDKKGRVTIQF